MRDGDYEWYVTLAELQHVTAAAEQLHIAQPTLTRMLSRLERRLGVALFDRRGKRLVHFVPDKPINAIRGGETRDDLVLVLPDAPRQVGRHAGVDRAIAEIGDDVDKATHGE